MSETRLDVYLTEKGLCSSRTKAKELIEKSFVRVNGSAAVRPAFPVKETDEVTVDGQLENEDCPYVSRGGLKLKKALDEFGISPGGRVCLDAGASTGGFTDCLLQNGAKHVYAVDVGHSQLSEKIAKNEKVTAQEGTNVRYLRKEDYALPVSLLTADLSFISLTKTMEGMAGILEENGVAVLLIKPQFECGPFALDRHGTVRKKEDHAAAIEGVIACAKSFGLYPAGLTHSPLKGGQGSGTGKKGNTEYLLYCIKNREAEKEIDVKAAVKAAFAEFGE